MPTAVSAMGCAVSALRSGSLTSRFMDHLLLRNKPHRRGGDLEVPRQVGSLDRIIAPTEPLADDLVGSILAGRFQAQSVLARRQRIAVVVGAVKVRFVIS